MMYIEQQCLKAKEEGLREVVLKVGQLRFGLDSTISDLIEHANPDSLDDLLTLIIQASNKEEVLKKFKPAQH